MVKYEYIGYVSWSLSLCFFGLFQFYFIVVCFISLVPLISTHTTGSIPLLVDVSSPRGITSYLSIDYRFWHKKNPTFQRLTRQHLEDIMAKFLKISRKSMIHPFNKIWLDNKTCIRLDLSPNGFLPTDNETLAKVGPPFGCTWCTKLHKRLVRIGKLISMPWVEVVLCSFYFFFCLLKICSRPEDVWDIRY